MALERNKPKGWLPAGSDHRLTSAEVAGLILHLATTNQLYYLHPSFGRFLGGVAMEPHGLVYKITTSTTNLLSDAVVGENESFWNQTSATVLEPETQCLATPPPAPLGLHPLRWRLIALASTQSRQSQLLGIWYSVALSDWGAWLVRAGHKDAALPRLQQALALYPGNLAAILLLHNQTNLTDVDVGISLERRDQINDLNHVDPQPFVQDIISQQMQNLRNDLGN